MKTRASGFTLLELLIVIAIIAVLAALLLPALNKAKASARRLDCLNRERQLAVAFRTYADEHAGLIPREGYHPLGAEDLNNWSQVQAANDVWYNVLPHGLAQPRASDYFSPPTKRPEFHSAANFIHCPGARFPPGAFRLTYPYALFSLAMNAQLIRLGEGPTINFSRIEGQDTVRQVLFLDNLLEGEEPVHPAQETSKLGMPAADARRFSPRHSKGGNLAFADGHAQWFPGYKVVQTDPSSGLVGGPIMPPVDIVWDLGP